jgi:hypothetical protein
MDLNQQKAVCCVSLMQLLCKGNSDVWCKRPSKSTYLIVLHSTRNRYPWAEQPTRRTDHALPYWTSQRDTKAVAWFF